MFVCKMNEKPSRANHVGTLKSSFVQFTVLFASLTFSTLTFADTPPTLTDPALTQEKTTFQILKEKLRIRSFTEYMTPAISGLGSNVPSSVGGTAPATEELGILGPTYTFNYFFVDYDIGDNWKVVFWQRYFVFFNPTGVTTRARNPRFAIRKVNPFNSTNLTGSYDLYIQPGTSPEAFNEMSRSFEFGFRHNTAYTFPASKWSIGMVGEFTYSLSSSGAMTGTNYNGWVMPWASYEISKVFSTLNFLTLNFMQERGSSSFISWDLPAPMVQNGIGINISPEIQVSLLLNTYLHNTPTLKNSFFSLWLNLNLL